LIEEIAKREKNNNMESLNGKMREKITKINWKIINMVRVNLSGWIEESTKNIGSMEAK